MLLSCRVEWFKPAPGPGDIRWQRPVWQDQRGWAPRLAWSPPIGPCSLLWMLATPTGSPGSWRWWDHPLHCHSCARLAEPQAQRSA